MNGFIEIYTDGWLRFRWQFTLRDYESFPFEQQVDLRKADLEQVIEHLKQHVVPSFDPVRLEIAIAYESKLNTYGNSEMPGTMANELYPEASRGKDS